jgi:transposase
VSANRPDIPLEEETGSMVTVGGDCHKKTHTFAAVEESGREIAHLTVAATQAGHLKGRRWAAQWEDRRWALEDCRPFTRRLEKELLGAGEAVLRVSPRLMAEARRVGRQRGKSDPIDALAVARAALKEPDLPVAQLDGPSREVKLLLDHHDDLVAERTRSENRLREHLFELEPEFEIPARALSRLVWLRRVKRHLNSRTGTVAMLARELTSSVHALSVSISALERELGKRVRALVPNLLAMVGCGVLSAARILAETADVTRFRSKAAYARFNGTAPIPVSSGNMTRFRLNRGGNRQMNAALHRIAITQIRMEGSAGHAYYQRRLANHDQPTDARRALKRQLSDEAFRCLLRDHALLSHPSEDPGSVTK